MTFSNGKVGELVVTFDRPLTAGPSAAANWEVTDFAGSTFGGSAPGVIAGSTVTVPMVAMILKVGPIGTSDYLATPPDVLGLTGVPAAAYQDFPTTFV